MCEYAGPIPWWPQQWKREKRNGVLLRNCLIHDIVGQVMSLVIMVCGHHGLWLSLWNPVCTYVYMCVYVIRSHQMYYMFGFLFLVFIILIVTCSETAILLCYFQLRAQVNTKQQAIPVILQSRLTTCYLWSYCIAVDSSQFIYNSAVRIVFFHFGSNRIE